MATNERPSRESFIAFWKNFDTFDRGDALLYIVYPGVLVLYAFVVRYLDPEGRLALPSLITAVAYVILYPYFLIHGFHKRFGRFIRCPKCGDWFGQDMSGAYSGPNPRFRTVIETGRCVQCGEPILADVADTP